MTKDKGNQLTGPASPNGGTPPAGAGGQNNEWACGAPDPNRELAIKIITEHHTYIRQIAGYHMAWFAFQVTANLTVLALIADDSRHIVRSNVFLIAFVMITFLILGILAGALVHKYDLSTKKTLEKIENAQQIVLNDPPARLSHTLPWDLFWCVGAMLLLVQLVLLGMWVWMLCTLSTQSARAEKEPVPVIIVQPAKQ